MNYINKIGNRTIKFFKSFNKISVFLYKTFKYSFTPKWYFRDIFNQSFKIGYLSLPIIGMTAIFTGGALAIQIYIGSSRWSVTDTVPTIVVIGIARELGPVLTALMIAGKIASSISAELGTMRVTEQIDAIKTLSVNPYKYLVAPRFLACLISLPFLTLIFDILGIFGGYLVSITSLKFNAYSYIIKTYDFMKLADFTSGIIKSIVFGIIIGIIGCYYGYNSNKGAEGVGRATVNSVVISSILIFVFNYILTNTFFS